jgi:hypothetical protein
MTWVELSVIEVHNAFYVTCVNDGYESAFIFNCKMHVMVMAHKLYMKPQVFIFLSNDTLTLTRLIMKIVVLVAVVKPS